MPIKQTVSALAKSTIKIAYDELDRTISFEDKQNFSNTALHDVREAALKIENQLAARQSLRNMRRLMPLFLGLEHYSKVVDVLCNGTPYLPWIWAPITLILRISSEFVEAFEQIIKGYASIAESLKRFEILSNALINELDFQQTVAVFYADILKFHKYAYKFVRRSGWKLIFSASWGRFERKFGNILEDLKHHGTLLDLEANAHDISQAKKMRDDIRKWREESQSRVRQKDNEQSARQYGSIMSWLKVNDVDQLAIIDSITSEVEKYQGTCGWILKNKNIRSWADAKPNTPALWLKGSAGTGKSVLCTQLVNFLKETKFVICHFCTYLYATSTMYEQILKSLLLQILRKDADLAAHVYKTCVMEKKSPTTPTLENLLQELFSSMSSEPNKTGYVWVIIDGLDECDSDKQLRLVRLINKLTSKPVVPGSTGCKVLVSSRPPSTPLDRLMRKQIVSLTEEKSLLNEAVRQYVGQRLVLMDTKLRQLNLQRVEVEEIQGLIVKKSDGMFLYARLVMDYLSSNLFFSRQEIKESVNQLPRKLGDFYQRILTQILAPLDHRSEDRIRCILGWIAFARRPLRKVELMSAITFSSGDHEIYDLIPAYAIDTVGTLIEERKDSTLSFIHNSVKEFLQTSSQPIVLEERQSLQEHGVATVACLLSGLKYFDHTYPAHDKALRVARGLHGFHVYATEFWTEYLLSFASSNDTVTADSSISLISLACELAHKLEYEEVASTTDDSMMNPVDVRLGSLHQYRVLQKCVDRSLRLRSLGTLESRVLRDYNNDESQKGSTTRLVHDKIETLLASYQEIVKFLLSKTYHPDLSPDELESFKANFCTAAFTCRLTSCSYATIGFHTAELLKEHEREHIRRFQCAVPGCQYPPFVSKSALKNHMKRNHNPNIASKPVLRHMLASKRSSSNHSQAAHRETSASREELQAPRIAPELQSVIMESMDVPPQVLSQLDQVPPNVEKWGQLWLWFNQSYRGGIETIALSASLTQIQESQYQLSLQGHDVTI
ncbi:hypothetical protein FVEN_g920 [Fusarium venenatum]|uniref:NACHT domain-containing protein n=1 Tax=Fusarium venenatum TaxID=56646 RepID=A0A2L2U3K8_9HYPO|nr:uncharacterized protein FVRRES_10667 [Fusarium venenatum]KAG8361268.1 hypothetical protein FVEN_g920 [Fusarium venenatum]KAH6967256.1 hypothetical protein EDB82DRAFT_355729 [Fusarium venenatum]CEI70590.1 unnamed protein product [Fusarium venenatum]